MQISRIANKLFLLLLLAVFVFVCARSFKLDMTHDEAYSFLNIKKFWYAQFLCNANSHWLNSLAMKISYMMGGEEPWQLRWLSIASAGGFFVLAYYRIKSLQSFSVKTIAFSLFCLNPFVLDYFVLARGYASAMFCEMLALYCMWQYYQTDKENYARSGLFIAGISAIANFNFFYFFAAYSIMYVFALYFKTKATFLRKPFFYLDSLYCIGIAVVVLRALLFIRQCSNDFGLGTDGFLKGIVSSYIDGATYLNLGENNKILLLPAAVLSAFTAYAIYAGIFKYRLHRQKFYFFSSLVLVIILFLTIFNHYAFGVLYPYYRSQLYIFPLFILVLISCLNYSVKKNIFIHSFLFLIAGILLFFFIKAFNFYYTFDFYHQSDSRLCLDEVKKLGAKNVGMCHEHYGVYINYYQESKEKSYPFTAFYINNYDSSADWVETHRLEEFDYLLLYPPYNLSYYKKRPIKFTAIKLMPFSKTLILKVDD